MQLVKKRLAEPQRGERVHEPVGLVTCPNCRVVMPCISRKGLEDEKGLHEAVYRCPQCGTETKRWTSQ
jgi:hypothetical protein